ncbi:MAG: hypothetical protein IPJ34_11650 [Myxococcales bacterium]|nr:hypothetical protein [Myxococcales bacterium]
MLSTSGLAASNTRLGSEHLRRLDRTILARSRVGLPVDCSFDDALSALGRVVRETIPNGRIFYLGEGPSGPVVGSLVSGVGLSPSPRGILVVQIDPFRVLSRFHP